MRADPNDHRWVGLSVLAEALDVGQKQARKIATQEGIRTTRTRPAEYHWGDIVTTAQRRKGQQAMETVIHLPRSTHGQVVGLGRDQVIVATAEGRLIAKWPEQKPELGDDVDLLGNPQTGWQITGPYLAAPDTFANVDPTSMIGKVRARIYCEALREAHGIVVRRGGSYEAGIDILARVAEIEQEAGIS